ncbi:energy transducer TonB [Hymenobacter sp. NST-14]|nr:energy transducer TonB [Hymenobacter piscis]
MGNADRISIFYRPIVSRYAPATPPQRPPAGLRRRLAPDDAHHPGPPLLDKEVLRVINKMPAWKPGTQSGRAVDVSYTLPVTFNVK